jgi:hypothetical protein
MTTERRASREIDGKGGSVITGRRNRDAVRTLFGRVMP